MSQDHRRARVVWVDTAKALAIVSVVLFHAISLAGADGTVGIVWKAASLAMYPYLLPMFFLVSGFLAGPTRSMSTAQYVTRRVVPLVWVWMVWSALYAVLDVATDSRIGASVVQSLSLHTILWFLPGLAVHLLLTRLMMAWRPATQVVLAVVVALPVAYYFPFDGWGTAHTAQYFVFTLIGSLFRDRIRAAVADATRRQCLMLFGVLASLGAVAVVVRPVAALAYGLVPVALVPLLLVGCRWASRDPRVATVGRYVGTRTLAVLVLHPLIIQMCGLLLGHEPAPAVAAAAPVAVTAASLVASFAVWAACRDVPGVFRPPWSPSAGKRASV